jgi:aryl-alcohol dehydrogenase-like predicted oxidoreductase
MEDKVKYRQLGKTGYKISEISLGTWQVGGKWGEPFNNKNAETIINKAIDKGINFIDTADVYSDGLSEAAVARVIKSRSEKIYIATKCGRKITPHVAEEYNIDLLKKFIDDSLKNMNLETLDLIQLHCPPTEIYYKQEFFEFFDKLKQEGKIQNLGVSVEKIDEALKAIEYPNVTTVQIIFNMFRQRPAEHFFKEAEKKNIGVIVRVPLASGLLTGKFNKNSIFGSQDHRNFNREGKFFDKGETFSGVNYEIGLEAVEELKKIFPDYKNLAPIALKWVLMFNAVSCVIPGASNVNQIDSNLETESIPDFTENQMNDIKILYEKFIKSLVHNKW